MARRIDKDHIDKWMENGLHLPTRTILLTGDIDESTLRKLLSCLHILQAASRTDPITVIINSEGGEVDMALACYDLLVGHDGHVTTRCVGSAMSAALVMMCAGDSREITCNSTFMNHPGTQVLDSTPTPESRVMWDLSIGMASRCDDIVYECMRDSQPLLTRRKYNAQLLRGIVYVGGHAIPAGLATGLYPSP
jgi:ATP-dependent protease ClpP protease subunit